MSDEIIKETVARLRKMLPFVVSSLSEIAMDPAVPVATRVEALAELRYTYDVLRDHEEKEAASDWFGVWKK